MDEGQALAAFSALSEPTRLAILRFLVTRGPGGASAGEIGETVGFTSSRGSFHLSALTRAGLLTSEKVSRQVIYRADFDRLAALASFLIHDCCGGDPQVLACCTPIGARGTEEGR